MLTTSAIVTVNTRFIITWIRCSIFGLSGPWKGLGTIPIPCTYKVCVLPVPTACSLGCAVMQRLLRWVDHVMRMSSNCLPGLDVFYMDSSPTASTCLEDQRSASLIIWKPFWRNVAFRLTNWRSWQWTGLRGEMPVRLVFQYRWPPQPGCRGGPSCTQAWDLQRDPSGPCCPTCNKVCASDFGLKRSSPKSQNIVAQRLRRIDGQLQGKVKQGMAHPQSV